MHNRFFLVSVLIPAVAAGMMLDGQTGWAKENASAERKWPREEKPVKEGHDRAVGRAFYSAPPTIPHGVSDPRNEEKECQYCHNEVRHIGNRTMVKTPHPQFFDCQQCHVQGSNPETFQELSAWRGLEEPTKGTRANLFTPATIPHRIFMRENCLSCHGRENSGKGAVRCPHPERYNCQQCHLPVHEKQF